MTDPVALLNAALEGRYRIERELGAGGMATVYLAADLKHHRNVALKVLRPDLAAVVGAERFLSEIETTAGLQHPHILPLFDSGAASGFLFYVMPFVEGESLRDRLDREKQLPVDDAVGIARKIADALDYAHERGVIHRDIKPANVLLSKRGEPLVSDFGIALAVGAAGEGRLTETGLSLGTPHYMSPEQATGDFNVGPPADIYALGCVLYEMLVGEPPYTGSTAQVILGKIVTGDPVSAMKTRSSIPLHVDAVIRKALEKLPADRFPSGDAFEKALEDPRFRHGPGLAGQVAGDRGPWKGIALAAVGVAVVLSLALGRSLLRRAPPEPVLRYGIDLAPGQELIDRYPPTFTLTPDGSSLVYVGPGQDEPQLWVKRGADEGAEPLGETSGAVSPSVSPGGDWVAFQVGAELRKVPLAGGASTYLADSLNTTVPFGATWLGDGALAYVDRTWRIRRVPATGGTSEVLWEPSLGPAEGGLGPAWLGGLPGGRALLFTLCDRSCRTVQEIWALDLESGNARRVATGGYRPLYSPTGHLLTIRGDGRIFAQSFDPGSLETSGSAVPVLEGVKLDTTAPDLALAQDGTLVMLSGGSVSTDFELVWVTRDGTASPVHQGWTFVDGDPYRSWVLSPDNRRVALRIQTQDGYDIWIEELPEGPLSRLTFREGRERRPRWTPDGRSVTFLWGPETSLDLWVKPADGTGEAELLLEAPESLAQGFYAPDGRSIVLQTDPRAGQDDGADILMFRPGEDSAAVPLLAERFDESAPAISPDSRWLAYESNETGHSEIYVRSYPDVRSGKWQISDGGGILPVWGHSGEELFYVNGSGLVAVRLETDGGFRVTGREVLFQIGETYVPRGLAGMYDVAADDQRFLMARRAETESAPSRLILVQNWFRELEERVGSGGGG